MVTRIQIQFLHGLYTREVPDLSIWTDGSCLMVAFAQPDEDVAGNNLIQTLRFCLLKFENQSYILLASAVHAIHKRLCQIFGKRISMYFLNVGFWSEEFRLCLLLPASFRIYLSVSREIGGSSRMLLLWCLCSCSDKFSSNAVLWWFIITWTKAGATSLFGVTSRPGNSTVCFLTIAFLCSARQHSAQGPITSQYSLPNEQFEWRSANFEGVRNLMWLVSRPPHVAQLSCCDNLGGFLLSLLAVHGPISLDLSFCLCQYWMPPDNLSE